MREAQITVNTVPFNGDGFESLNMSKQLFQCQWVSAFVCEVEADDRVGGGGGGMTGVCLRLIRCLTDTVSVVRCWRGMFS